MNLITVIIPVYNTEKYLDRCINSIINQTLMDIEILCINDGSTDNSLKILSDYANKDNRIRIISQINKGLSAARNTGIKAANGVYILHVDSDDWIESDMCEIMYKETKEHNADIVTSHVYFDYPRKAVLKKEPYKKINDFNDFLMTFTVKRGINSVCNKLIKHDLYLKNNIEHYEDISLGEDSSALLRLIVFARVIATVNKAFYHYDIKTTSMTGSAKKNVMEYIQALSKVEDFYRQNNVKTDMFPLLRLKIAYINLYGNMHTTTDAYRKLKEHFYSDIRPILSHPCFYKLSLKYKCFVFMCLVFRKFHLKE